LDVIKGTIYKINYSLSAEGRQKSVARFQEGRRDAKSNTGDLEITPAALQRKMKYNHGLVLIDVREADERALFHIGGRHIPLASFLKNTPGNMTSKLDIIVYCERGGRSMQAVEHLRTLGFTNAFSLRGGIQAWRQQSQP
ncbi:MAG: rhodanese-like domain-containing protein, partial [Bacteroidetes bacterium]|nr:rhodanese-like domain-containing protein [Bacteroidota bacterium]